MNRPVAAVTLSSTPTSTLLMRENLGQLTSKGLTAEWELRPAGWMSVIGGIPTGVFHGDEVSGRSDAGGKVDSTGSAKYGDGAATIFQGADWDFEC